MGEIYANSRCTLVRLGDADHETGLAIASFPRMADLCKKGDIVSGRCGQTDGARVLLASYVRQIDTGRVRCRAYPEPTVVYEDLGSAGSHQSSIHHMSYLPVLYTMGRALARVARIKVAPGDKVIPGSRSGKGDELVNLPDDQPVASDAIHTVVHQSPRGCTLMRLAGPGNRISQADLGTFQSILSSFTGTERKRMELGQLLLGGREFDASRPHDKVFGLLELLTARPGSKLAELLVVYYRKPCGEVFRTRLSTPLLSMASVCLSAHCWNTRESHAKVLSPRAEQCKCALWCQDDIYSRAQSFLSDIMIP